MPKESARIRRRRAAIYRRNREFNVVSGRRGGSMPRSIDRYYRRLASGKERRVMTKEEVARENYMTAWDALRRAEAREKRSKSYRGPLFYDPLATADMSARFPPAVGPMSYRTHSHVHRKPSHHVGPCDFACRMGGRGHIHKGSRFSATE